MLSKRAILQLFIAVTLSSLRDVDATLTIAAADTATGQIGASGTSCVGKSLFEAAYHSVPGHGLILTQALPPDTEPIKSPVYDVASSMLLNDTDPEQIIKAITEPGVDNYTFMGLYDGINLRQYGIVDLKGNTAGYTGKDIEDLYFLMGYNFTSTEGHQHVQQDIQGTLGESIVYSAQGNIVSNTTVTALSETFETVLACDLVELLYLSLNAVFDGPEEQLVGDIRCFDTNFASGSTVFIHVEEADGNEVVHIENENPDPNGASPWLDFKSAYDEWRNDHPCGDGGEVNATSPGGDTTSTSDNMSTMQSNSAGIYSLMGNMRSALKYTLLLLPLI